MAHAPARRGGLSGDEPNDRRLHVALDERGCFLLVGAADLADQDDRAGFGVVLEERQAVDEVGADDRIAADPDARRLADAGTRQVMNDLVGKRAAPRHNANGSRRADLAGEDPDLALAGADETRAVGSYEPRAALGDERHGAGHVENRNPLRYGHDQRN